LGLSESCQTIAAGDEVEKGKPDPDVYLLSAERLDVPPDRCLALEDSLPGCQAAKAAGMVAVAIPNGHTANDDFGFVDYIFGSLLDVVDDLDSIMNTGGSLN
jgi:riboflavin kinase